MDSTRGVGSSVRAVVPGGLQCNGVVTLRLAPWVGDDFAPGAVGGEQSWTTGLAESANSTILKLAATVSHREGSR